MNSVFNDLKQNIRSYRKSLGLTQQGLAERISVSTSHVADIEIGRKKPSLDLLIKIASALNVDAYLLLAKPNFGNKDMLDSFSDILLSRIKSDIEDLKKDF